MKSTEQHLEDIKDGVHGKYPYTLALTDFMDADAVEGMLAELVRACESGYSVDVRLAGQSLGNGLLDALRKRAEQLASKPDPTFESNYADVKREM